MYGSAVPLRFIHLLAVIIVCLFLLSGSLSVTLVMCFYITDSYSISEQRT